MIVRRFAAMMLALACATLPLACFADKADEDKPVNFSSDQGGANYETKSGSLKGNVVLTQGTMTIRADRIDFKQNPDNSVSATVYGNPLSFRQKKDDSDEYFEGYAQRAVYDGQKQFLELFDRALLRQGNDEIRSNYISYNTATGVATAAADTAGAVETAAEAEPLPDRRMSSTRSFSSGEILAKAEFLRKAEHVLVVLQRGVDVGHLEDGSGALRGHRASFADR